MDNEYVKKLADLAITATNIDTMMRTKQDITVEIKECFRRISTRGTDVVDAKGSIGILTAARESLDLRIELKFYELQEEVKQKSVYNTRFRVAAEKLLPVETYRELSRISKDYHIRDVEKAVLDFKKAEKDVN